MLVHVIDCATLEPGRDPITDLDVIEKELAAYVPDADLGGRPLAERTRIIILNKADVPEARELAEMVKPDLEARGYRGPHRLRRGARGPARADLRDGPPRDAARRQIARGRAASGSCCARGRSTTRASRCRKENGPDGAVFRVAGERPTRWVRQTDFSNDEAVGYLADRLGRLGVEEELVQGRGVAGRHRASSAPPTTRSSSTGSRRCRPAPSCSASAAPTCACPSPRGPPVTRSARRRRTATRPAPRRRRSSRPSAASGLWHVAADEDDDA